MNSQLQAIIDSTIESLEQLETSEDIEYIQAKSEVVKLQKQLLSASVLQKERLSDMIKIELKAAELRLFKLSSNKRELELAFLKKYIREKYE